MTDLLKKYDPAVVEPGCYQFWLEHHFFRYYDAKVKINFSLILPPPNVTGRLHLGHAWDATLQDVLARYHQLLGQNVLWVPGMDHAGIATEIKVAKRLEKIMNKTKHELGRDKFIDQVYAWKSEYAQSIREQWAQLGLSLDYEYEQFTLSSSMQSIVKNLFIKMYQKGLIYRGKKIVNWDVFLKTAISDIEVNYKTESGNLYYIRYDFQDKPGTGLVIATTRPETMFADVALIVNPHDRRYKDYVGQTVINPVNNEPIPVLADDYVDVEYGTGVMKCTPAHDANDFLIGERLHLSMPNCMNPDGTMNQLALTYQGEDRFTCRKNVIAALEAKGNLLKTEAITHQVGYSERTNALIEPYLSTQWFVKAETLSKAVMNLQQGSDAVKFYPPRFKKTLDHWLANMNDWCISRQIWWGHRIPAWYHRQTQELYVGINPPTPASDWVQDADVLDTWFSSALWPLVCYGWPDQTVTLKQFFPTSVLVTAYDIIFFWVARMMFQTYYLVDQKPFNAVVIHGLIRDAQGRKMSKSLNNGVEPVVLIKKYGADALRAFLLSSSTLGQDLRLDETKLEANWNFINKLWNAARFIFYQLNHHALALPLTPKLEPQTLAEKWIKAKFDQTLLTFHKQMKKYQFNLAYQTLTTFVWHDFCDWYLELIKLDLAATDNPSQLLATTIALFKQILTSLHPFIPFVTEKLYQQLTTAKNSLLEQRYPQATKTQQPIDLIEIVKEITILLRQFYQTYNLKPIENLPLNIRFKQIPSGLKTPATLKALNHYLDGMIKAQIVKVNALDLKDQFTLVGEQLVIEFSLDAASNLRSHLQTVLLSQKTKLEQELKRSQSLLKSKSFLTKAPPLKVETERQKYQRYQAQYKIVNRQLQQINTKHETNH